MQSKIISLPDEYLARTEKQRPLSPQMIVSLLKACAKQHAGILYGQSDIRGSFTSLINRGLIVRKKVNIKNDSVSLWQVTREAIVMLRAIGIEPTC